MPPSKRSLIWLVCVEMPFAPAKTFEAQEIRKPRCEHGVRHDALASVYAASTVANAQ